jgi:hypothetical protein
MSTTEIPRGDSGPRYVRLQADLVLEVTAAGELRDAALALIDADTFMPREEREHARRAVGADESEALAYLVDPAALVTGLPGLELVQASWSCAHTEYDPLTWADDAADDADDADDDADDADDDADDADHDADH